MKIVTVLGARPQFVKAAAVNPKLAEAATGEHVLVHSGQHYDPNMSEAFFHGLGLDEPKHNLGISGGTHGAMTGRMLQALDPILAEERPDVVIVYGDTNTTLAGALAAQKMHIPVAHVEAGVRCFDKRKPEEINRILTEELSTVVYCPSKVAQENLRCEGRTEGVVVSGDVMRDLITPYLGAPESNVPGSHGIQGEYALATIHRAANTTDSGPLREIIRGFDQLTSGGLPVIVPLHPRTVAAMKRFGVSAESAHIIDPVDYEEFQRLLAHARVMITDSGGVEKEAYWHGTPCVTLLHQTEWPETVDEGWNRLSASVASDIVAAVDQAAEGTRERDAYGPGDAADKIAADIVRRFA